jgi:hypothetical protein
MFAFNTAVRVGLYPHPVRAAGLDHCYDCAAEVGVLRAYRRSAHAAPLGWDTTEDEAIVAQLADMSRACEPDGASTLDAPPQLPVFASPPPRAPHPRAPRRVVRLVTPQERARHHASAAARAGEDLRDVLNRKRGHRGDGDGDGDDGGADDHGDGDAGGRRRRRRDASEPADDAADVDAFGPSHQRRQRLRADDHDDRRQALTAAATSRPRRDEHVAEKWVKVKSTSQDGFYYYNEVTGACQWEVPLGYVPETSEPS